MSLQVLESLGMKESTSQPSAEEARQLLEVLTAGGRAGGVTLVTKDQRPVHLSGATTAMLREVLEPIARGESVTILPAGHELTPRQAAEFLKVSRQYLTRLLDEGKIAFRRVGTHRRVSFESLVEYKRTSDAERSEALAKLTRESEELGLYPELEE
ncbi:MAG TPA: helix-turn-helix domain-containing protein [Myxococcales bacterium]|jgi:excisionase family DNA binding protein|nr:helix-turn-helix domain-containing protein [Myxococcales bacterium]